MSQTSFLAGSLTAPCSSTNAESDEENQAPDTTTGGSPHDIPLSPIELRELTTTLGRLYQSCKYAVN